MIHDEKIIHNDLKPENFVCIGPALRLIDFGIANKIELDHTSVERDICCGTVNYMAPETIDTHEDHDYYKVCSLEQRIMQVVAFLCSEVKILFVNNKKEGLKSGYFALSQFSYIFYQDTVVFSLVQNRDVHILPACFRD